MREQLTDYIINCNILLEITFVIFCLSIQVFIGLGFPYEGPAPLEAIAQGCIFLNAKVTWKLLVRGNCTCAKHYAISKRNPNYSVMVHCSTYTSWTQGKAWKDENVQYNVFIKRAWGLDWEILTGKGSLCFNRVDWVDAEVSNIQQQHQQQKQNEMTQESQEFLYTRKFYWGSVMWSHIVPVLGGLPLCCGSTLPGILDVIPLTLLPLPPKDMIVRVTLSFLLIYKWCSHKIVSSFLVVWPTSQSSEHRILQDKTDTEKGKC